MKNSLSYHHYLLGVTVGAYEVTIKNLARSIKSASDAFRGLNEAVEKIKKED